MSRRGAAGPQGPLLPDWRDRSWRWNLTAPDALEWVRSELAGAELKIVKSDARRTVFTAGGFFFKVYPRRFWRDLFHHPVKRELASARQVAARGIPAVEYLGFGVSRTHSVLVTRAAAGAESVHDYWFRRFVYDCGEPEPFFAALEEFLAKLLNAGLRHPDLHLGNLLFEPETHRFLLVDLYGVTAGKPLSRRERNAALRILLDLRARMLPERMTQAAIRVGNLLPDEASTLLQRMLRSEFHRLRHEWPRRRKQILSGYAKFSRWITLPDGNRILIRKDQLRQPLVAPDLLPDVLERGDLYTTARLAPEAATELLLFSYWLQFLGVRHRRVAAMTENGRLYFERLGSLRKPPQDLAAINAIHEYLLVCDLGTADFSNWGELPNGLPVLSDPTPLLAGCPYREEMKDAR